MLEHVTKEELLKEVSKRLDQNKLTWEIIYYYDRDETKMELKAEEVKFALTFTNKTNIERNYFCRKVYKGWMEPTILRIQQKARQKEQESKIYETLKLELENYKK